MFNTKIALPLANGYEFASIHEVMRCQAEGNYTRFYFIDGREVLVSKNLGHFEKILTGHFFVRIHRTHLINLAHLKGYIRGQGGYAIMTDNVQLEISNQKKQAFLDCLPIHGTFCPENFLRTVKNSKKSA